MMRNTMNNDVQNFMASHTFSNDTKTTYSRVLYELAELPIEGWGAADLLNFVERENWGNAWQCTALYACRKFIRWKFGDNHPALQAKKKKLKSKRQRSMNYDQLLALLASFNTYTPKGARDQALVAIAVDTGFRVGELAKIKVSNIDFENLTIQVTIKGGQWEYGIYSPETAVILDRWMSYRKPAEGVDHLFIALHHKTNHGKPLTKTGMQALFKRWGIKLGFKLSPHDARRTFARLSNSNGAPTRTLQEAGRWSDIKQVERYTEGLDPREIIPYLPMSNLTKKR